MGELKTAADGYVIDKVRSSTFHQAKGTLIRVKVFGFCRRFDELEREMTRKRPQSPSSEVMGPRPVELKIGEKLDPTKTKALSAGGVMITQPKIPHFA